MIHIHATRFSLCACIAAFLLLSAPVAARAEANAPNINAPDAILGSWKTVTDMGGRKSESIMEFSVVDGALKAMGKSQRGSLEATDVTYEAGVLKWKINIQQNIIQIEVNVKGDTFEGAAITPLGRLPITGARVTKESLEAADKALQDLIGDWTIYTTFNGKQSESKMRIFKDKDDQDIEAAIIMLGSNIEVRQIRIDNGTLRWRVAIPFVSGESAVVEAKLDGNKFEGTVHSALGDIPIKGEMVDTAKLVVAPYDSPKPILGAWDVHVNSGTEQKDGAVSFAEQDQRLQAVVELAGEKWTSKTVEFKKVSETMSMARITVNIPKYGEKPLVFELVVNGDAFEGEELYSNGTLMMTGTRRKA